MTKVLMIAHFREQSGWGQASRDYLNAMDSVGIDVVPRTVKLGLPSPQMSDRFLELEKKSVEGCTVCIQHVLPHLLDYNDNYKNIALFATETDSFKYSKWPSKINTMDEAWVINQDMIQTCYNSGINIPIKVVNHARPLEIYDNTYPKLNIEPLKDTFVFYFIGDLIRRKNLTALVRAFHTEFSRNEPVSLVIKTSKFGASSQECTQIVTDMINKIKVNLKLYKNIYDYKSEVIITDHLSEEQIYQLHNTCDCMVVPSYGEAWCLPAHDALGFGKPVIGTNTTGLKDLIIDNSLLPLSRNGLLVESMQDDVFGMTDTFDDIFTAREKWDIINVHRLRIAMRNMYEGKTFYKILSQNAKKSVERFSYEKIGNRIKELLCPTQ